jgi:putative phosphoesterase
MIIGVLSDTHGTLHPGVAPLFREAGVELILHAGDVGEFSVIEELSGVARVVAVRGNVDRGGNVGMLPGEVALEIEGVRVYMTHVGGKPAGWLPRLPEPRPGVAICGHSHIALLERLGSTLFLNPGAAGTRRRFNYPLTVGLLHINGREAEVELLTLER